MKDNFESYEAYRTNYMKNLAADALLFEYLLLKNKVVDKPKSLAHDFILYDKKIDVKVVTKWLNISESKKDWLTLNVNNKLLDIKRKVSDYLKFDDIAKGINDGGLYVYKEYYNDQADYVELQLKKKLMIRSFQKMIYKLLE